MSNQTTESIVTAEESPRSREVSVKATFFLYDMTFEEAKKWAMRGGIPRGEGGDIEILEILRGPEIAHEQATLEKGPWRVALVYHKSKEDLP